MSGNGKLIPLPNKVLFSSSLIFASRPADTLEAQSIAQDIALPRGLWRKVMTCLASLDQLPRESSK
jgi:hypothetical protein